MISQTLTDIELIRCRLNATESDIEYIRTVLKRIEERHRGKK